MPHSRPISLLTPDMFCWSIAWHSESPSSSNRSRLVGSTYTDHAMTKALRSLCVLLTILGMAIGVAHLATKAAAGEALGATGHSPALSHTAHRGYEDVSRSRSCLSAGPCWSMPQRVAVLPPRAGSAKRSRPVAPADISALWDLSPPDQPPRVTSLIFSA